MDRPVPSYRFHSERCQCSCLKSRIAISALATADNRISSSLHQSNNSSLLSFSAFYPQQFSELTSSSPSASPTLPFITTSEQSRVYIDLTGCSALDMNGNCASPVSNQSQHSLACPGSALSARHQGQADRAHRWNGEDECMDVLHSIQSPRSLQLSKLALIKARKGKGGQYMDFSIRDPGGIFCLESVPCCSGPFDDAGQCKSSQLGGFCSCKLPVPVIRGLQ